MTDTSSESNFNYEKFRKNRKEHFYNDNKENDEFKRRRKLKGKSSKVNFGNRKDKRNNFSL